MIENFAFSSFFSLLTILDQIYVDQTCITKSVCNNRNILTKLIEK